MEQVVSAKRFLESVGDPSKVTGVVFMGMGEPFDNYDRSASKQHIRGRLGSDVGGGLLLGMGGE